MKVAITCNTLPEGYQREADDAFAEFDSPDTIKEIKKALLLHCDEVAVIEADEGAYDALRSERPDFVFNIAEGIRGESRESHIPAMLEMLGIPYTGSGVETLAITLDKRRTKEALIAAGVSTPRYQLVRKANFTLDPRLKFPLFAKPNFEGSSRGVTSRSLAQNSNELKEYVQHLISTYKQPAIIEEYLPGREFTVSLLGNSPPKVLPIVEVSFDALPEGAPRFDSYEVKWVYDSKGSGIETVHCPADVDPILGEEIKKAALKTFEALDIRDLCRMDMRLDKKGRPNVIDVNALPGLIPDPAENSRFPKSAYAVGYSYSDLIGEIFLGALKREGVRLT